jgi:hypothetical protein
MVRLLVAVSIASLVVVSGCSDTPCAPACSVGQTCVAGTCVKNPFANDATGQDSTGGGDTAGGCPAAVAGDLVMNEILADPGGADVNGDGKPDASDDEFVEIVNVSGHAVSTASVALRVGNKAYSLGTGCLSADSARVVFGAESGLGLTNSGGSVALEIGGAQVQSHSWQAEGGKDQSLTLTVQLDPSSGWSLHKVLAATAWSPGTCANGQAFPSCAAVVPPDGGPDAAGDVTEPVGDTAADSAHDSAIDAGGDGAADGGVDADVTLPCGVPPIVGELLINEVLADPGTVLDANQSGAGASDDEFVEIVNVSDVTLDLAGVRVAEPGGSVFVMPVGTCLLPGRAVVIFGQYGGGGDFGDSLVYGLGKAFGLNNGGDTVTVTSATGAVLTALTFGAPPGATKQSLTRAVDGDGASAMVAHTAAVLAGGAPMSPGRCQNGHSFPNCEGAVVPDAEPDSAGDTALDSAVDTGPDSAVDTGPDSVVDTQDTGPGDVGPGDIGPDAPPDVVEDTGPTCGPKAAKGQLVLNEILSDPGGVDVNGDGVASATQDEFIELVNLSGVALDLTGVAILAGPPGSPALSHTFGALCLPPYEGVVVFSGGSPTLTKPMAVVLTSNKALGLNNGGETVVLRAADGSDLDTYAFTTSAGQSWVRIPDGTGPFGKHKTAPDSADAPFSPGACNDGSSFPFCLQ